MLLMLVVQLGGEPTRALLRFDREAIGDGQWWRLLTCNIAHLGWYHCLLNLAALAGLVAIWQEPLPWSDWLRKLLILSLGVSLGLYVGTPQLQRYVGFSGVLHGLMVLGLTRLAGQREWVGVVGLLGVAAKLGFEILTGAPLSDERLIGGRVITESHLYGAGTATICIMASVAWRHIKGRDEEA